MQNAATTFNTTKNVRQFSVGDKKPSEEEENKAEEEAKTTTQEEEETKEETREEPPKKKPNIMLAVALGLGISCIALFSGFS